MSSSASVGSGRDSCPSCQVCGGEASGFHYGVDSCEGCKGFFRRCITQGMTNRCANDEKCEITPFSRNSCQFCRLKKCFDVGMSREGSRLGRRPKRLKGCHGSETKPCPKVSDVHQSPASASKMSSFGQLTAEGSALLQRLDSSASEKSRLSISSEGEQGELTSSHSDYYLNMPSISKDGCYYRSASYPSSANEQHSLTCRKSHSSASSSAVASGTMKTEPYLSDVVHLPPKMKLQDNRLPFSSSMERPGCLRPAHEPAICGTEQHGAELPRNMTACWSDYVEPLSGVGSSGRIFKNMNRVYGHVPETMTLSGQAGFIKREIRESDESAVCDEAAVRAFIDCPLSDLCTSQDSSFARDFLVENENDNSYVNSSEGLCYDRGAVKEVKWESCRDGFTDRISQSKGPGATSAPLPTSWTAEISEPFRVGDDDKLALPCTSSEPEEVAFSGSSSIEVLIAEAVKPPDRVKMRLIRHVVESVVEAHLNTCNYTSDKVAVGIQRYKEMSMKGQPKKDPSKVWTQFVDNMAPVIKRVVKFSKKIPGFSELHQDDQIGLIKQGSFEVILTRYARLFVDDGMFVPDMTVFVPRDIMRQMPLGNFFEEQYHFAAMFNKLKLCDSEIGLLTAAMIVCPDRPGLMNCEAIRQLHLLLVQSLYDFMTQNHPDGCFDLFSKTLHILPLVQRINESHSKQLNNIKLSTPEIMFPPLHDEVFDKTG